jgi:uncharacterized protein (DUF934 family)
MTMRYIAPYRPLPQMTLANDADVERLTDQLTNVDVVALQFPQWVDGRAYSQATLLRRRLGFKGEIRAVGEVLVDMLPLLQRTGFTAVQLRAGQSIEAAQRALGFFDEGHYQGDVSQTQPWFARSSAWA